VTASELSSPVGKSKVWRDASQSASRADKRIFPSDVEDQTEQLISRYSRLIGGPCEKSNPEVRDDLTCRILIGGQGRNPIPHLTR
jgi:hypothetical protein